jgi:curved DNA-binding protein CbpA
MRKTKNKNISMKELQKDLKTVTGGKKNSRFGDIRERMAARKQSQNTSYEPYDIQKNQDKLTPDQLRAISAEQVAHIREQGKRQVEEINIRNAQLLLDDKEARRLRMENVRNSFTQIPDFRTRSIIMNQIFEDAIELVDPKRRTQILEELYNQAKKEEENEKTSRPVSASAQRSQSNECPKVPEGDLNILKGCSNKRDFLKLIFKYHPDKATAACNSSSLESAKLINEKWDKVCKK